jgi:hypothetical protein
MTRLRRRRIFTGLALAVLCAGAPPAAARAANERIYVTVVDADGKPVGGLTAADFGVELDGTLQEIVSAAPAAEPLSLVIMTDRLGLNSTYTAFDVRQTLTDFVSAIRRGSPDSRIALTTFDGTAIQVTKFTSARTDLDRALTRLATTSPDAMMLDAMGDVCKMLVRDAPTDRRVIFTLLAAYRPDQSNMRHEVVSELLRLSGASLWTVEVRQAESGNFGNNVREVVLDSGGLMSGGTRDIVGSRTGVATSTKHMAELMLSQYAVTYAPGGGTAHSQLRVGLRRAGVRILAPRWISR